MLPRGHPELRYVGLVDLNGTPKWGVLLKWLRVVSGWALYFSLSVPQWPEMIDNRVHSAKSESLVVTKFRFHGIYFKSWKRRRLNYIPHLLMVTWTGCISVNKRLIDCRKERKGINDVGVLGAWILFSILNEWTVYFKQNKVFSASFLEAIVCIAQRIKWLNSLSIEGNWRDSTLNKVLVLHEADLD